MYNCCFCGSELDDNTCQLLYDSSHYNGRNCYKRLRSCYSCWVSSKNNIGSHKCHCCNNYFYSTDEINPLTHNCYVCDCEKIIHRYAYKPTSIRFCKQTNMDLCIGIELEMNGAINYKDLYYKAIDVDKLFTTFTNNEELVKWVVLKRDGSIGNMGFEMVTQPSVLDWHVKNVPWKLFFKKYSLNGRRNCGLHFHVDKSYLTNVQCKVMDFFAHRNYRLLEVIGGRKFNRYCYWTYKDLDECGNSRTRYEMINFQNPNTIEFRFFKSPKNYNQFLYRLEFVDAIVQFARANGDLIFKNLNLFSDGTMLEMFWDFIKNNSEKYCYLIRFFKSNKDVKFYLNCLGV